MSYKTIDQKIYDFGNEIVELKHIEFDNTETVRETFYEKKTLKVKGSYVWTLGYNQMEQFYQQKLDQYEDLMLEYHCQLGRS